MTSMTTTTKITTNSSFSALGFCEDLHLIVLHYQDDENKNDYDNNNNNDDDNNDKNNKFKLHELTYPCECGT